MPRKYQEWSKKQRRQYQRLISGLKRAEAFRERIRVMTLTSSDESDYSMLNDHWQVLKKRIMRTWGKMEYWKLRTNEGNGVLHIVYRGTYIPQKWLSQNWNTIHTSRIVYIQALHRKRGSRRLARYLAGHYLVGHDYLIYTRQSWSWGWCFRGFVRTWRQVVITSNTLYSAIRRFNIIVTARYPLLFYDKIKREKWWSDIDVPIRPLESFL